MEHMDRFIAGKAGVLLVVSYLLSLLPMRAVEILPIAVLLATLFSLGNLSRRQEITAAMSGGIHPWRCVKLLLAAGVAVSLFALMLSEWVIPFTNRHAQTLWKMDIRHFAAFRQTRFDDLTVAGRGNVFYSIRTFESDKGLMENVIVELMQDGKPRWHVQAKRAQWTKEAGWTFYDGVERVYSPAGFSLVSQTEIQEKRIALPETPEDLIPQLTDSDEMNYGQYRRYIKHLRVLGIPTRRQEVELYSKLAFPWTSLIVMLLGIPFAFRKSGGKVMAVGFALAVAFFYFGLMEIGRALGQKPWCPPLLGAWLANLIFLSFGGWLFNRMKRLA
jgi:lipopolysaccharide export system permease protein